ncbi:thioredoxin-like protein YtpP [Paenibacillus sp. J31TS4]|uniref:thioredoxin family protein n=1 Tax=Paenibacillus sp. J31TS4 TaxID=2807195 RepID=UPI001B0B05B0|nr:thioredoxin family protein [Paenibacillus sp. J31TS4]GIP40736.1 thioredoxin-like protein YtpP [Paenibacillus sp. J31TS4]
MNKLSTEEAFREQIAGSKPTVAVFKADWCKDCHYIEPFMPALEQAYADRLTFVVIDRDELPDLCDAYHILGIPSFIVFKNGQELTRFVSKLRKTREEIEEYLDKSLQVAETISQ